MPRSLRRKFAPAHSRLPAVPRSSFPSSTTRLFLPSSAVHVSRLFAYALLAALCLCFPVRAAEPNWSGSWETRWREGGARLELRQEGGKVAGVYPLYGGRIEGEAVGRELRGRWFEGDRFGGLLFVLAPDGRSFMGRYDTGEWWTGERANAASPAAKVDQATPRRTVRTFLTAGNFWSEGALDEIGKVAAVLDFGPRGATMRVGEKIAAAQQLYRAVEQTTFRLWSVPGRSAAESEVKVVLHQAGTSAAMTLTLRKGEDGNWRIAVPTDAELEEATRQLLARSGGRPSPPDEHLGLQHPRAAMKTFLQAFRDWDGSGRAKALSALDLSEVREAVREHEGVLAAEYLKNVLDRIGFVTLLEIPDDPGSRAPYVHFKHQAGDIVIAPHGAGANTRWRFTAETVRKLRPLYAALEDMPLDSQAGGAAPHSIYFRIRERIRANAPFLLERIGSVENWQMVGAVLALTAGLLAAVAVGLAIRAAERLSGRTVRNSSYRHLLWAVQVALMALVWLAGTSVLGLPNGVLELVQAGVACILAGCIVWSGWQLVDLGSRAMLPHMKRTVSSLDDILLSLLITATKIALVVGGFLYVASALSIPYSGIVAGLGIGGLAFAFASKETLSNVFGAAILAADRPFRRGDWITTASTQGTVEHVGVRSTRIRTAEDSVVVVPNGKLADDIINNLGTRRSRLVRVKLPLAHDADLDSLGALIEGIQATLEENSKVLDEKTQVGLINVADAGLELDVTCYLRTNSAAEERTFRHDLILAILRQAREFDISVGPLPEAASSASKFGTLQRTADPRLIVSLDRQGRDY